MRKLTELIVLVRGGNEVGSAIAHKLFRSHFRVCITEIASPLDINRGICFSEAVYDTSKMVEGVTAERTLVSLDQIYKIWRNGNIAVVVDPDMSAKPLLKPDVLVNAMMLNRQTNTKLSDAELVIGVGSGFNIGTDVYLIVESNNSRHPGRVLIEGEAEKTPEGPALSEKANGGNIILAEDSGVFTTKKSIGDAILAGDVIGKLNDAPLPAPASGVLCGLLRNEVKVLANAQLAEIDSKNDKTVCFAIRDKTRAVAGGVLEAIMMSTNVDEIS